MNPTKKLRLKLMNELKQFIHEFTNDMPYCFSYDWEMQEIAPYEKADFAEEICNIKEAGFVKRIEIFKQEKLVVDDKVYNVRLQSYGHSKRQRIVIGINPLAASFDKLLFDYVYVFLQEENQESLQTTMEQNINKEITLNHWRTALEQIESYKLFFNKDLKQKRLLCQDKLKNEE